MNVDGASGQFIALLAAFNALLVAAVAFLPRVQGVVREMRRPDNIDYQRANRVIALLRKVVRALKGSEAWESLPEDLRREMEEEIQ